MGWTARSKQQTQLLAAGLVLLALAAGFFFMIFQTARPRGERVLKQALLHLEQQQTYDLSIIETAPRYELSFQGRVERNNRLKGTLPEYNLEVLSQDGRLRLKHEENGEWVKAETLGLHGLSGFLLTPLELLQNEADCFPGAFTGETITLGQRPCRTFYFTVSDPEKFVQTLFPEIDYSGVSEVTMGAAVVETEPALKQLCILIEFDNHDGDKIERSYHLDY